MKAKPYIAIGAILISLSSLGERSLADNQSSQNNISSENFKGFYTGLSIRRSFVNIDDDLSVSGPGAYDPNNSYFQQSSLDAINGLDLNTSDQRNTNGSIFAGYNYSVGEFLIGPELEANFGKQKSSDEVSVEYPCCAPSTVSFKQEVISKYGAALKLKAGMPFKKMMPYIYWGLAWKNIRLENSFSDDHSGSSISASDESDRNTFGYTLGAGVEHLISKKLSLRAEYGFEKYILDDVTLTASNGIKDRVSFSNDFAEHTAKIGLIYRF